MLDRRPSVVVTGAAGCLGRRLIRALSGYRVVGVDLSPPELDYPLRFERIDLGREASCPALIDLLRETGAFAVVHLAFSREQPGRGTPGAARLWQVNVAGTARVMEAITEVNRSGGQVSKFIYPGTATAYGPDLLRPAVEGSPLNAHTFRFAVHKREADEVVQYRAGKLGNCSTYLLRLQLMAGPSVHNYLVDALRGIPTGGKFAARWRDKGVRIPLFLPSADRYLHSLFQFSHVDDVAHLMGYILSKPETGSHLTVLNVAARGNSLTLKNCADLAGQRIRRLPSVGLCSLFLRALWKAGVSGISPDELPYLFGSQTVDTSRLRAFLGSNYVQVIRSTVEDALRDCFSASELSEPTEESHSVQEAH